MLNLSLPPTSLAQLLYDLFHKNQSLKAAELEEVTQHDCLPEIRDHFILPKEEKQEELLRPYFALLSIVGPNNITAFFLVLEDCHYSENSSFEKLLHGEIVLNHGLIDAFLLLVELQNNLEELTENFSQFLRVGVALLHVGFDEDGHSMDWLGTDWLCRCLQPKKDEDKEDKDKNKDKDGYKAVPDNDDADMPDEFDIKVTDTKDEKK